MDFSNYLKTINNCDADAPLLSDTPLGHCLSFIPLRQVPPADLIQTTQALNVEQLIPTSEGLARDYRGLSELMGFSNTELEAHFKRLANPTKCLIDAYTDRNCLSDGELTRFSVNDFIKLIEKLERFDLVDDLLPTLVRIANESQNAHLKGNKHALVSEPAQSLVENGRPVGKDPQPSTCITQVETVPVTAVQQYDAFVCYAPEDYDYAMGLVSILEKNNKRVLTPDNIFAGQLKYNALVQMIAEDCKRVILILTPNFIKSKDCDFQAKFAYEIAIQSAQFPKVIPILYEPMNDAQLPCLLRVISKIDMTHRNANQHAWQLKKILGSLNQANETTNHHLSSVAYYEPHSNYGIQPPTSTLNGSQVNELTINSTTRAPDCQHVSSHNRHTPEPIIDLAHSQSSRTSLNVANEFTSTTELTHGSTTAPPSELPQRLESCSSSSPSSQNPLVNWYRSFKQKVRGNAGSTISPNMSSRVNLLSPDSISNFVSDNLDK